MGMSMGMERRWWMKKREKERSSQPIYYNTQATCRHPGSAAHLADSRYTKVRSVGLFLWWCVATAALSSRPSLAQTTWLLPAPACQRFRYVSRQEWGGSAAPSGQPASRPFKTGAPSRVFVHQAWDGRTCADLDSCSVRLRAIQAYHRHSKNWPDIGYNFLISGDGTVYEGLGYNRTGFHTLNFNGDSLGVALIGTFQDREPSGRMLEALALLAVCAVQRGRLSPSYTIHGHRDATCTICPGQAAYTQLMRLERFQAGPLRGYTCPRRASSSIAASSAAAGTLQQATANLFV